MADLKPEKVSDAKPDEATSSPRQERAMDKLKTTPHVQHQQEVVEPASIFRNKTATTLNKGHTTTTTTTTTTNNNNDFFCSQCKVQCSNSADFIEHLRIHRSSKSYVCTMCPYRSSEKGNLIRHMYTHTGEKPYACSLCEHQCADKTNMMTHMRSHNNLGGPVVAGNNSAPPPQYPSTTAPDKNPTFDGAPTPY